MSRGHCQGKIKRSHKDNILVEKDPGQARRHFGWYPPLLAHKNTPDLRDSLLHLLLGLS